MRRALALVLIGLLCFQSATAGSLLVIYRAVSANPSTATPAAKATAERSYRIWRQLLDQTGVQYKQFTQGNMKSEFARLGVVTHNFGTSFATTESFDAVMHLDPLIGASAGTGFYRPDSILRTAYADLNSDNYGDGLRVPHLYAFTDRGMGESSVVADYDAACCTTGVIGDAGSTGGPIGDSKNGMPLDPRTNTRWETAGSFMAFHAANPTRPPGGFRGLLQVAGWNRALAAASTFRQCGWCDSLFLAGSDSVFMWERPFSHIAGGGAKPAVFVYPDGLGGPQDSIFNADGVPPSAEFDVPTAFCALARLDSLSGFALFDKNKLPLVRALTVEGLCSRNRRRAASRGINPGDTTFFYATIDSLSAMDSRLPIVFGVNADPDSMTAYLRDLLVVASKLPLAKFTPVVYSAAFDTGGASVLNGGATKYRRPRDVWGRFRARAAYGDGSCAGADTSLYCGLLGAKGLLDSVLTANGYPGRISTFAIAPQDDWSPKTMRPYGGGPPLDSVLWAVRRAGFTGIQVNTMDMRANGPSRSVSGVNPWGYYVGQRRMRETISGNTVTLLAHSGGPVIGSHGWVPVFTDSVAPFDSAAAIGVPAHEMSRTWAAFTQDQDGQRGDADSWEYAFSDQYVSGVGSISVWNAYADIEWPKVDHAAAPRKGYVLRLSANDLSGFTTGPLGPGARNGFWIIKQAHSAMKAINHFGGRTIIRFGYPEEVKP